MEKVADYVEGVHKSHRLNREEWRFVDLKIWSTTNVYKCHYSTLALTPTQSHALALRMLASASSMNSLPMSFFRPTQPTTGIVLPSKPRSSTASDHCPLYCRLLCPRRRTQPASLYKVFPVSVAVPPKQDGITSPISARLEHVPEPGQRVGPPF